MFSVGGSTFNSVLLFANQTNLTTVPGVVEISPGVDDDK
jgi:hypothetical protein